MSSSLAFDFSTLPPESPSPAWAVVVARVGAGAKSRLAGALDPHQRTHLALAMLSDVLDACLAADLAGIVAVIDAPAARLVADARGALSILDSGAGDMNAAATAGIRAAQARGATTVVVVPGDVPLLRPDDFVDLIRAAGTAPRAVVVGASRDGGGTNALLLRPPDVIQPAFGPPSVGRHVSAGRRVGALTSVRRDLGLTLDVDTPNDLVALTSARPGGHTAAALAQLLEEHALVRP
jgi:2-phospho-L-lactate/phosphoenolpyruvate guanylyltransferase